MENISSDTNYSNKHDEIDKYDEGSDSTTSENTDTPSIKESQDKGNNTETTQSHEDVKEKVAEKVEGGP